MELPPLSHLYDLAGEKITANGALHRNPAKRTDTAKLQLVTAINSFYHDLDSFLKEAPGQSWVCPNPACNLFCYF